MIRLKVDHFINLTSKSMARRVDGNSAKEMKILPFRTLIIVHFGSFEFFGIRS